MITQLALVKEYPFKSAEVTVYKRTIGLGKGAVDQTEIPVLEATVNLMLS